MLITNLYPLLERYSLSLDLIAAPDNSVTLTIVPRKVEGAAGKLEPGEAQPISITAKTTEIDAELRRGVEGALGQLIAARKTLGDQIAEQHQAAEAAKAAAAETAKAKASSAKPTVSPAKIQPSSGPPVDAKPDEPASLWD